MRIISIDPGYERVGVAVIEKNGNSDKEKLLFSECFKTDPKKDLSDRFLDIGNEIERVIKEYSPQVLAIEDLFYSKNQKTVMGVAGARGLIIYVGKKHGLEIQEYNPLQIKNATTGYGKADKKQVYMMTRQLIDIPSETKQDDEIDAIAVGLTAFAFHRF